MSKQYQVVNTAGEVLLPKQGQAAFNNWCDQVGYRYQFLDEARDGDLITITVQ